MNLQTLIDFVEVSLARNGDIPFTIGHFHNLLKMVQEYEEAKEMENDCDHCCGSDPFWYKD